MTRNIVDGRWLVLKCALIRLVSSAEKKCRNRRESGRMVAVTSASSKAVVMANMFCKYY